MRSTLPRLLLTSSLALTTAGCALPYYLQAATGQARLLRQRVPIAEVVEDADIDAGTRQQLSRVAAIRRFAVTRFALPDNDSYTSYVELDREAVVWNVIAAPEFSIEPVTWCFPIAGCVAYRGYFDPDRAERFGRKLASRGYDVFVGGSPAYSTLGYFDDPVLSTMLGRDEVRLAATLFHELAHQRIYIPDDTDLSESFATAVEQHAVEAWLAAHGETDALTRYRARLQREREFARLISRQRERLKALFAAAEAREPSRLRAAKAEAYASLESDYEALKSGWNGHDDYAGWFEQGFDNARLVALTSYHRWVPGLRLRLETLGPGAFYAEIEALVELGADARRERLDAWNSASVVAGLADHRELVDVASEIGADDRLHSPRRDAERPEAVVATHARDRQ